MSFQIAIDGPVASGKGTVARLVAQHLKMLYVDTGAMYRAVAWAAQQQQIGFDDEAKVARLIPQLQLQLRQPSFFENDGRLSTIKVNGKDISWEIRTETIGEGASQVAMFAKVREALVKIQQQIAASQDVVMEGRDITYRVLPQADIKIFLTASLEKRTQRRMIDLQRQGAEVSYEQLYQSIQERDQRDSQRLADPLQKIAGVWELDTSNLTIPQVVEQIVQTAQKMRQSTHNHA